MNQKTSLPEIFGLINSEYERALDTFGPFENPHYHLAKLEEEFQEYKNHVFAKTGSSPEAAYELIQLANVAIRRAMEIGDTLQIKEQQLKRWPERG